MSSNSEGYIYALIGGATLIVAAIKKHKTYREIENHPTSKASTAAQGLCELQGFAWPKEACFKSYSGEELVYYNLQLQKYVTRGTGKNKKSYWETQFSRTFETPFYLADATGLVDIQLADQRFEETQKKGHFGSKLFRLFNPIPLKDKEGFGGTPRTRQWGSVPLEEQSYLLEHVINSAPAGFPPANGFLGLFSGKFRIVENSVGVGCPLYGKGYFSASSEFKNSERLLGLTDFSKHVFNSEARTIKDRKSFLDKDRDGKVNEEEIRSGYSIIARSSRFKAGQSGQLDAENEFPVHGALVAAPEQNLLLYCMHQDQVVAKLKRSFYYSAAMGILLLSLCVGDIARKFYIQAPKRNQPINLDLNALHEGCTNKLQAASCRQLLSEADQLRLPANYKDYYQGVLCRLGDKGFCKN